MAETAILQALTDTTVVNETWVHGLTDLFTEMEGEMVALSLAYIGGKWADAWREVRMQESRDRTIDG